MMNESEARVALYGVNPRIVLDKVALIPDEAIVLSNRGWSIEAIVAEAPQHCKVWPVGTITDLQILVERTSWELALQQSEVRGLLDSIIDASREFDDEG